MLKPHETHTNIFSHHNKSHSPLKIRSFITLILHTERLKNRSYFDIVNPIHTFKQLVYFEKSRLIVTIITDHRNTFE